MLERSNTDNDYPTYAELLEIRGNTEDDNSRYSNTGSFIAKFINLHIFPDYLVP